jgi:hypothetical protein
MSRSPDFLTPRGARSPRLKHVILKERPPLPRMKDLKRRSQPCSPLPASFSQTPTGHRRFVASRSSSVIRQDSHKAVDGLFPCFLALESCRIPPVNHWLLPSGRQRAASPCNCHVRSTSRQLIAGSQQLATSFCQRPPSWHTSALRSATYSTICSPLCQTQNAFNALSHRAIISLANLTGDGGKSRDLAGYFLLFPLHSLRDRVISRDRTGQRANADPPLTKNHLP